jgi:antitoxin ChpS
MLATKLRKVGGSVMLAVPPALLEILHVQSGDEFDISIENGRLVAAPRQRPRYTLDELLARCRPRAAGTKEEGGHRPVLSRQMSLTGLLESP